MSRMRSMDETIHQATKLKSGDGAGSHWNLSKHTDIYAWPGPPRGSVLTGGGDNSAAAVPGRTAGQMPSGMPKSPRSPRITFISCCRPRRHQLLCRRKIIFHSIRCLHAGDLALAPCMHTWPCCHACMRLIKIRIDRTEEACSQRGQAAWKDCRHVIRRRTVITGN